MDNMKIKVCPLCNGFSNIVKKSKTIVQGNLEYTTYVECKVCHCRGPRFLFRDFEDPRDARLEAIKSWNRRGGVYDEEAS